MLRRATRLELAVAAEAAEAPPPPLTSVTPAAVAPAAAPTTPLPDPPALPQPDVSVVVPPAPEAAVRDGPYPGAEAGQEGMGGVLQDGGPHAGDEAGQGQGLQQGQPQQEQQQQQQGDLGGALALPLEVLEGHGAATEKEVGQEGTGGAAAQEPERELQDLQDPGLVEAQEEGGLGVGAACGGWDGSRRPSGGGVEARRLGALADNGGTGEAEDGGEAEVEGGGLREEVAVAGWPGVSSFAHAVAEAAAEAAGSGGREEAGGACAGGPEDGGCDILWSSA